MFNQNEIIHYKTIKKQSFDNKLGGKKYSMKDKLKSTLNKFYN